MANANDCRASWWSSRWAIGAAVAVALAARFALSPLAEHWFDMGAHRKLLVTATTLGVAETYAIHGPPHGPLAMALYGASGSLYALLAPDAPPTEPWFGFFVKLPAMLLDVAAAFAVLWACRRLTDERRARTWMFATLASPILVYVSALWGQTDVVYSMLAFSSIAALAGRKPAIAGALFAASMLHKPNAMLLAPVVGVLALRDLKTLVRFGASWAAVMLGSHLYFFGTDSAWTYGKLVGGSTEEATRTLGNALNVWRIAFGADAWQTSAAVPCVGTVPCRAIGWGTVALTSLPYLWIAWKTRAAEGARTAFMFAAASSTSVAAYLFGTGMHERYLFPYVLLAIPFAQRGRLQTAAYVGTSTMFLVGMLDHFRPFRWLDRLWATPGFAGVSAWLLVGFGLFHMALVVLDYAGLVGGKDRVAGPRPRAA